MHDSNRTRIFSSVRSPGGASDTRRGMLRPCFRALAGGAWAAVDNPPAATSACAVATINGLVLFFDSDVGALQWRCHISGSRIMSRRPSHLHGGAVIGLGRTRSACAAKGQRWVESTGEPAFRGLGFSPPCCCCCCYCCGRSRRQTSREPLRSSQTPNRFSGRGYR